MCVFFFLYIFLYYFGEGKANNKNLKLQLCTSIHDKINVFLNFLTKYIYAYIHFIYITSMFYIYVLYNFILYNLQIRYFVKKKKKEKEIIYKRLQINSYIIQFSRIFIPSLFIILYIIYVVYGIYIYVLVCYI